jgi:hypothetical protein
VNYCETDFVWYAPDEASREAVAMFPYREGSRRWFERRPATERGRAKGRSLELVG